MGIIGSNISDAKETAAGILEDLSQASMSSLKSSMDPVHTLPALVSPKTVTWQQFLSIEKEEVRIGTLLGRPRDKLITVEEMLRVASLEQTTDGRE